ncbi:Hypothetical predicted protein, partial [Mytilus galloprovincialis]
KMPLFKGKRKRGLKLTLYKKPWRYKLSQPSKRPKPSGSSPVVKYTSQRSPHISKKMISPMKTSTPIRRNLFAQNQEIFDESQDSLEEHHKEDHILDNEDDIEEDLQENIEEDSQEDIGEDLQEDIEEDNEKDQIKYIEEEYKVIQSALAKLKKVVWRSLYSIHAGPKNESDILSGSSSSLSPLKSRVNFACPNENILRGINPLGSDFPSVYSPGLIDSMINIKAEKNEEQTSYILMFDGKKSQERG